LLANEESKKLFINLLKIMIIKYQKIKKKL